MTVRLALLGAGRIGRTHAAAIGHCEGASLVAVHDPCDDAAGAIVEAHGARRASPEAILADPTVDAVLICTPTDQHADQVEQVARSGKAILCEKPIDLDVARVHACVAAVEAAGVGLMVGFNRRFDPHFAALKRRLDAGVVGKIELVQITSRDPAPPPADYLRRSGGLFRDMMIHDFDMARFLLGEEIVEVTATGSVLVDAAVRDTGDVDTAAATLRSASGALCTITNSRRASYGYDQRIEVHGSKGLLSAGNPTTTTLTQADADGFHTDPLQDFFMERYRSAYRREIETFCRAVARGTPMSPGGGDGLRALLLAEAAERSLATGRTIPTVR